jgi:hypothetical protein
MAKNGKTNGSGDEKATRKHREFWSRNLQATKVRAALEGMGASVEDFETRYKATRKAREKSELDANELTALKAFQEHKNLETLRVALGVKSAMTAAAKFTQATVEGLI